MKRTIIFILAFLPMLASADEGDTFSEETVEGVLLKYTIISESEKTCMVGDKYYSAIPTARAAGIRRGPEEEVCQASGDITIPEEANGYRVVRIEDYAFNQAAITSVYIPSSVETIGSSAFTGCTDLKSVRLPIQLKSIESYTFYGCESLTSIDIPDGVTSIGESAFANCKQMKGINIPSSVTHFGGSVFWNTGFTSLPKLPEDLTTIPNGMFYQCTQLTSIEIPQNITRIGDTAFGRCPFSEIQIPASVTYIGVAAFANCKNLTNIVIPDNVTDIGFNAFWGCSNLKTVTLSKNIGGIREGSFYECTRLESVIIPNGVKFIDKQAFGSCSSLGSIDIPETVEEIGEQAFFNCSSLTQLFIPKSVVNFKNNKDDNWWQYSYRSFIYGCNSLTSLVVDKDNPVYDSRNNCNAIIETASNKLIVGCTATMIPEGITAVGLHAFDGFQNLTSITLPRSLNIIELGAFNGSGLHEISIPESVTSIGDYAFSNCTSLKGFNCYAENVPETESGIFYNTKIKSITLHVPATSVSAYHAVEPWKNFKDIVALTEQGDETDYSDYIPFVDGGKSWYVARSTPGQVAIDEVKYYIPQGIEVVNDDGKAYYKMKAFINNTTETGMYLIREEDRKVYLFDTNTQKEYLMFDYSLKAGDTYETYSYEYHKMVKYEVLSVSDYKEGPEIYSYVYDEETKKMTIHRRYLRRWVVQSEIEKIHCDAPKTWIEGIGSLEGPFANLYDSSFTLDNLAFVLYNGGVSYLPFTFRLAIGKLCFGCNMPIGEEYDHSEDKRHQLTYELEGNRLHVYGKVLTHGGANNYAYFMGKLTDHSSVLKLNFKIQEIGPLPDPLPDSDGLILCTTDFYVEGFQPSFNYIIIDNQGVEHPVINKEQEPSYRPFVEDGKVWAVRVYPDGYGMVTNNSWIEYCYFDGDTIIGGQTCKQMKSITNANEENWVNGVFTPANKPQGYIGAWYEKDKKVYYAGRNREQFELLYDFTLSSGETMDVDGYEKYVVNKMSGGLPGFKGSYYEIGEHERWFEGVGSDSWPFVNHPWFFAGSTGHLLACRIGDEFIYCSSSEADPMVMGARKRIDFTHTIKVRPKAPIKQETSDACISSSECEVARQEVKAPIKLNAPKRVAEESLYGEYNDVQLGINLNPLDDAYLVRITDETGKSVYEKAVNAGSIVGLNVDISTYPKGRYTVTVENGSESFTGEFEAQTTGIVENLRIEKLENESIYDLQGRCLSGKPAKGVYIENGRKRMK